MHERVVARDARLLNNPFDATPRPSRPGRPRTRSRPCQPGARRAARLPALQPAVAPHQRPADRARTDSGHRRRDAHLHPLRDGRQLDERQATLEARRRRPCPRGGAGSSGGCACSGSLTGLARRGIAAGPFARLLAHAPARRDRDAGRYNVPAAWARPLVSESGLVERSGVKITQVAVTGDGGLVDLRFTVVDANKAASAARPRAPAGCCRRAHRAGGPRTC